MKVAVIQKNQKKIEKINLVGSVVPMPGDNIKRRVILSCLEEVTLANFKYGRGDRIITIHGQSYIWNCYKPGNFKYETLTFQENIHLLLLVRQPDIWRWLWNQLLYPQTRPSVSRSPWIINILRIETKQMLEEKIIVENLGFASPFAPIGPRLGRTKWSSYTFWQL